MEKRELKRASKAAVICYGFGDLASQFVWTYVGSYLTIFYTDIVGFAPAIVSAIMLVARIWDAINDPMIGAIAERTHSRFGRFRPWIAIFCPFLALFGVLTFVNLGNDTKGVLISAAIYIIAGMLYTAVNIPYGTLAGVMTEDSTQRNMITTSRAVGMNVGMLIVNSASSLLALRFSGAGAEVATGRGYLMTALIYCIIAIPLFYVVFFTSKEVIQPVVDMRKVSIIETLKSVLKNRYLIIVFAIGLLQMLAYLGRVSITTYYAIYCLGSYTLISVILTIPSIGGIIGSLLVTPVAKKIGKRNTLMLSFAGEGVALLIIYLADFTNITQIIIGTCIYGLFNCGYPLMLAMTADAIDYQEDRTGIRADGTTFAISGMAGKIGNAIGSAAGIVIIARFGYVANAEQSVATQNGINFTVNLIPAIVFFIAALILIFWKNKDSDFDKIRQKLSEKSQIK